VAHIRCSTALNLMTGIVLLVGCSGRPGRISPPSIDTDEAAAGAMELYDLDKDGFISGAELDAAPALLTAMRQLDTNTDQQVSADEISARVQAWEDSKIGLASVECTVELDGRPLVGAEVVYETEPYLSDSIASAKGKTNKFGRASMSIPMEHRPRSDSPPGMQFGLYRVRITMTEGDQQILPSRFNTESTLGQEISNQDAGYQSRIVYRLKSK